MSHSRLALSSLGSLVAYTCTSWCIPSLALQNGTTAVIGQHGGSVSSQKKQRRHVVTPPLGSGATSSTQCCQATSSSRAAIFAKQPKIKASATKM